MIFETTYHALNHPFSTKNQAILRDITKFLLYYIRIKNELILGGNRGLKIKYLRDSIHVVNKGVLNKI